MTFDLTCILESKRVHRGELAALSLGEKLRMLDELRQRVLDIRESLGAGNLILRDDSAVNEARKL